MGTRGRGKEGERQRERRMLSTTDCSSSASVGERGREGGVFLVTRENMLSIAQS